MLYIGLRRSPYGCKEKNGDDLWWAQRAKEFAAQFSKKELTLVPVIIQIVGLYRTDGGTRLGFEKPAQYTGANERISFDPNCPINHEKALTVYDQNGVKAIIQFEPGNSSVSENLEIAHRALGHHACIIGYGIDAEWYYTRESYDKTGLPIPDDSAEQWVDKILSFNSAYSFFIKHWLTNRMPLDFSHPNLWYLSDSQMFTGIDSMMVDFSQWGDRFRNQIVGFQYGYPADKKWWEKLNNPPFTIGNTLLNNIRNIKFLFWVDFTACEVDFTGK